MATEEHAADALPASSPPSVVVGEQQAAKIEEVEEEEHATRDSLPVPPSAPPPPPPSSSPPFQAEAVEKDDRRFMHFENAFFTSIRKGIVSELAEIVRTFESDPSCYPSVDSIKGRDSFLITLVCGGHTAMLEYLLETLRWDITCSATSNRAGDERVFEFAVKEGFHEMIPLLARFGCVESAEMKTSTLQEATRLWQIECDKAWPHTVGGGGGGGGGGGAGGVNRAPFECIKALVALGYHELQYEPHATLFAGFNGVMRLPAAATAIKIQIVHQCIVYSKHCEILLLDARQEPTASQQEVTALNMAILRLLGGSVGVNLNARINTNMHTAAHLAALTSNADALKLLAELGADLNSPSRTTMSAQAETPAQIVIKNEDAGTFAMLRSLGSAKCDIRPELVEGSMNKLSRSGFSMFKKWEQRRFEVKEGVLSYYKPEQYAARLAAGTLDLAFYELEVSSSGLLLQGNGSANLSLNFNVPSLPTADVVVLLKAHIFYKKQLAK